MSDIKENTTLLKESEAFYTAFEPKTSSRFIVKLTDKEGKAVIPTWLITEVSRPKVRRDAQAGQVGKWTWLPIIIRCYDPIVPSATQSFYEYITKEPPPLFDMEVTLLGPVGDTVEKWEIKNAKFSEIDFGVMDWSDTPKREDGKSTIEHINVTRYYKGSGPMKVTAVITYDVATLLF